jgi:hypothetical protein
MGVISMKSLPREDWVGEGHFPADCSTHSSDAPADVDPASRMLRKFSHRCRNSLSGIKLGLYFLRKDFQGTSCCRWNDLRRSYDEIEKMFDRLDRIYQSASLALVRSPLGQLFTERLRLWRSLYPDWAHTIRLDPPDSNPAGDFDPSHLGLGLDAFVMWRAESGHSREPCLAWRTFGGHFEISWQETPDDRLAIDAHRSSDSPLGCQPGDCTGALALLLLARVAADHGGDLETRHHPSLSAQIRWPQFREHQRKS